MISRVLFSFSLLWFAIEVSTSPLSSSRRTSNPGSGTDTLLRRNDTTGSPLVPPYDVNTCSRNSYTLKSNDNGTWPYSEYKTVNITSPVFKVERSDQSLAKGLIFLTLSNSGLFGYNGLKQQGAVIMTPEGDLIWSGPEGDTSNLRTQTLYNQTVLTTWSGHGSAASNGGAAHGYGIVTIYNTHYNTLYTICPSAKTLNISNIDSCVADVHESYITNSNTILVTVYNISLADLSSVGGPKQGYVRNSLVVELDVENNEILWVWNPQDHVPFNASHSAVSGTNSTNPWDWFHVNSIQSFGDGYLINSRGTWSSYFVNQSGDIEWELNGETGGDFGELPEGYNFSWQHHARLHPSSSNSTSEVLFTVFNDANANISTKNPSSGLTLILNLESKSLFPYLHLNSSSPLIAFAEGSHSLLSSGNHFVGYGVVPYLQEFGEDGNLKYSAQFAYNNHNNTGSSYRAFKSEDWHAVPNEKDLVLKVERSEGEDVLSECAGGEKLRGYVSWNGDTDVTHYVVNDGDGGTFEKKGFETEFVVKEKSMEYVQVAAWIGEKEVGRSNIVKVE